MRRSGDRACAIDERLSLDRKPAHDSARGELAEPGAEQDG